MLGLGQPPVLTTGAEQAGEALRQMLLVALQGLQQLALLGQLFLARQLFETLLYGTAGIGETLLALGLGGLPLLLLALLLGQLGLSLALQLLALPETPAAEGGGRQGNQQRGDCQQQGRAAGGRSGRVRFGGGGKRGALHVGFAHGYVLSLWGPMGLQCLKQCRGAGAPAIDHLPRTGRAGLFGDPGAGHEHR